MEVLDLEVEDFLAHYGVLGMKWGVRKDRKTRASSSRSQETKRKIRRRVVTGVGIAGGAAGGVAIGRYATKKATTLLRSKSFSKKLAGKAVKVADLNKVVGAMAKPFIARKFLKKNIALADLLNSPKGVTTIAVGAALTAGLLGMGISAAANKVADRHSEKDTKP